ncbi:MAG: NnrU family protein [Proteobacteria bacterium]|nr:NnrU family protein [Pseudomonadota bacterium]
MSILILGLILFLGAHTFVTLRGARERAIAAVGAGTYRVAFSVVSLAGFALIVWGFHVYRRTEWVQVWYPPEWTRHVAMLLMWFAFVSIAAMGKRPSRIRGWLRHPMLNAVKLWSTAHLIANGDLGGIVLFGSFLAWASYDRVMVKRRGDLGAPRIDHFTRSDAIVLIAGTIAYAAMLLLHPVLIGVSVLRMG